ncbi:hypothetical protein [Nostoc sp.]
MGIAEIELAIVEQFQLLIFHLPVRRLETVRSPIRLLSASTTRQK